MTLVRAPAAAATAPSPLRRTFLGVLAVIALAAAPPALAQIQTAAVTGGQVRGVVKDGVASFKGVPFAAPPIGELRWKPPQPVQPWTGVRSADAFGPAPMQDARFAILMNGGAAPQLSEDCLYLNVWTPAKDAGEKLPVMVWIYGGAFAMGMTSAPAYDGTRLAQRGIVLVSVAYRVGPLGFLAHPQLSAEGGGASGCYGIQDQVAGLRWVKENIAQFGGDPSRVTIFGESAGGISVSMLTVVPAAKGLFQRAISQSGGSMAPIKTAPIEAGVNVPSLKLAEEAGKRFLGKLGVADIKAARALSAEDVQKGAAGMGMFWPVADGRTIPGDQSELFEAGKFNDTPILIGTNSDEGAMFVRPGATPATFEKQIKDGYGAAADAILQAYPHASDAEAFKSTKDLFRESAFAWHTWTWAKLQARHGKNKAFVYYFDHRTPGSPDGASHATEIPFVFGTLGLFGDQRPQDAAMSQLMAAYWVNFAKSGDPNGPGLPAWPAFEEKAAKTMTFDESPGAKPLANLEKLQAFDAYYAWRRQAK
jgi:para-nitrobenzyl esterase